MALPSLLDGNLLRCMALLVGIVPLAAASVAAQGLCDDPDVTVLTTAPSLDGYELLFRQNAVSFYALLPAGDSAGSATVLIRNGNRHPVEVSYGVELRLQGDAGIRTVSLGRHCARIGPQGYALSSEEAPAQTTAVRVRNLTIGNLVDAPDRSRSADAGPASDPRTPNPGERLADSRSAEAAPGESAVGPDAARPFGVLPMPHADTGGPAATGPWRESVQGGREASARGPGAVVASAATRVFHLLAMAVLALAGLALLPPVFGALYLFVLTVVVLTGRLFGARSR